MNLWTATARDTHNANGSSPFIAPMTINTSKPRVDQRWRQTALFASLLLITFTFSHVAAQVKSQRRITALQMGDALEGSRVTIVSDSALNDYEAYRRGDRFYVKIPLAELATSAPGFRGDGFDDVQVQKVGDSVIVSFKLQPGATARVDQRSNHLNVIFFSPNRVARTNSAPIVPTRVSTNTRPGRVSAPTVQPRDAAGPVPPGSPTLVSESSTTGTTVPTIVRTTTDGQSTQTIPAIPRNLSSGGNNRNAVNPAAVQSPSPLPAASPTYTFPTTVTPTVVEQSRPVTVPTVTRTSALKTRGQALVRWVSTNRLVALAIVLGVLFLMGLVALVLYGRGRKVAKTRKVEARAQPKFTPDVELEDMLNRSGEFAPVASVLSPAADAESRIVPETDMWVLRMQSQRSSTRAYETSDEQEREVFEL